MLTVPVTVPAGPLGEPTVALPDVGPELVALSAITTTTDVVPP